MQRELEQKLEQEQQLKVRLAELEPQFNAEAFADLQRAERECLRCIERLETGLRHKRENCDRLHTQIAELTEAQKLLNAKQLQLQRLEQIWECSEFLRSIYDRARPEITRLLIESISEEASRIFAQLVDNYRLRLRWIDEEKDRYALIVDEDGQSRSFANLSGGEQMSAALALRMALIKELSSLRLAFFDEPTAHMDSERRRNLASQIAEIKGFEQIFVISHDDTFESQIHNVVRIP
jgi:exonuclease SbcC